MSLCVAVLSIQVRGRTYVPRPSDVWRPNGAILRLMCGYITGHDGLPTDCSWWPSGSLHLGKDMK